MLDKIGGGFGASLANDMHQLSSKGNNNGSASEFDFKSQNRSESAPALSKLEEILPSLIEVLQQLVEMIDDMQEKDSSSGKRGGNSGGNMESPASTGVTPGSSHVQDEKIPQPTEHIQSFNLGGKEITVGGDGTSSAEEVQATADTMKDLYQNSDTFRSMVDSSSNKEFEVSVGRRSDNMSWGNADGRLFMNAGNVSPGNNDSFQSLLAHEFAHASIDQDHGAQMERIEAAVASQA